MAAPPPPSNANTFEENGIDLIAEAESALRNPSAQRFLVSVLSQRARLESQRRKDGGHGQGARQRQTTQSSVSRLQPSAFECLVRLAIAMLEACMEEQNYLSAYQLLTHTAGFCTVSKAPYDKGGNASVGAAATDDQSSTIVYMTARIGIHPIFADLKLWERVMANHLQDRPKDRTGSGGGARGDANSGGGGDGSDDEADESDEYEAAVTTIYEMLGYGVPAEDLAKFATRVSEERGWFATERGQALLMLARRLSSKRDEGDHAGGAKAGDLDIMANGDQMEKMQGSMSNLQIGADILKAMDEEDKVKMAWTQIAWAHPAGDAPSLSAMSAASRQNISRGASKRGDMYNTLNQTGGDAADNSLAMASPVGDVIEPNGFVGKAAVTSLASFGANCVATGGLDGSVFLAHTIRFKSRDNPNPFVSGTRLEWGNTGTRGIGVGSTSSAIDGEFGVGAVSCLAAARGAGYRQSRPGASRRLSSDDIDDGEMLSAMDGCRIVAGTTGGDLRVWSVKDIYASSIAAANADGSDAAAEALSASVAETRHQHTSGATSNSNRRRSGAATEDNLAAASRLKYPLKGRALSGHRGGVTCLDVPSHIYRPDSLVSGGADGLIKLWSLRQSTGRRGGLTSQASVRFGRTGGDTAPAVRGRNALGTEAIEVLTGHSGKVITVKTAWHGDRLLSGGTDRTVRLWDLAGSGGKCLNTLEGHLGWVTQAHYWGPHTLVSASTDRSIALWDTRAGNHALFVLRYHLSPISDLLVGSRTEFLMVSSGADGAVATWDFRAISGVGGKDPASQAITKPQPQAGGGGGNSTKTIREPVCTMSHCQEGKGVRKSGAVLLSKGAVHERSVMSASSVDGKMMEWDVVSGRLLGKQRTGHTDVVSCLSTFMESDGLIRSSEDKSSNMGGLITSSWDGTIRMKRLQLQHK